WHKAYVLVPAALALATSLNTLRDGFAYDDLYQVLDNDAIKQVKNLPFAFTSGVWAFLDKNTWNWNTYFRPLFTSLFTINYAMFGISAWGWHLVNVLIHAAVAFFVFAVCAEITGRNWPAITAAAIFAVHPVHAESVAFLSGITDPLIALFLLPAFYFYLRFLK